MSINSITFIFWFLPVFLVVFYICKLSLRSSLVLLASLFIYAWGSIASLVFLVAFIILNYFSALEIESHKNTLPLFIVLDIAFLCLFKYLNVGAEVGITGLPIGISYYTFQGISYLIDVKRGDAKASGNPARLALYLCMFPKMNMGPIVKYKDIDKSLDNLKPDASSVSDGILKFSIGLCKKTVIAVSLAEMTELCWIDAPSSTGSAWLGIIGFCLQLYYDFSGYSDMAIGLGKMIGLEFKENFLYPFEACSVTDFWRRWHASLGAWFKDYVYIPLGGNKKTEGRTYINILIVWLLSGMWHDVSLNFIFWGLSIGLFICIEKKFISKIKLPKLVGMAYTLFAFLMVMVFFNSADLASSFDYFSYLFGGASAQTSTISSRFYLDMLPQIVIYTLGASSLPKYYCSQLFTRDDGSEGVGTMIAKLIFILLLLAASTIYIVYSGYTPFLYREF